MTVHFRSHFTDAIKATGLLTVQDAETRWAPVLWGNVLLLTSFIGQTVMLVLLVEGCEWRNWHKIIKPSVVVLSPKGYSTLSSACLLLWSMMFIRIYHPCVHCVCALHVCTVCVHCVCVLHVCTACVHCMCALHVCTACVYCVCALRVCTACVYCVCVLRVCTVSVLSPFPVSSCTGSDAREIIEEFKKSNSLQLRCFTS